MSRNRQILYEIMNLDTGETRVMTMSAAMAALNVSRCRIDNGYDPEMTLELSFGTYHISRYGFVVKYTSAMLVCYEQDSKRHFQYYTSISAFIKDWKICNEAYYLKYKNDFEYLSQNVPGKTILQIHNLCEPHREIIRKYKK